MQLEFYKFPLGSLSAGGMEGLEVTGFDLRLPKNVRFARNARLARDRRSKWFHAAWKVFHSLMANFDAEICCLPLCSVQDPLRPVERDMACT